MALAVEKTATLASWVEAYIAKRVLEDASEKTVRIYHDWLDHPITQDRVEVMGHGKRKQRHRIGGHPGGIAAHIPTLEAFDSLAAAAYFTILKDRGLSASTRRQALATVKAFVNWLRKREALFRDPLADITVKVPLTLPDIPKASDFGRLLKWFDNHPKDLLAKRNRAMILVLAESGLRSEEMLSLKIDDYRRGDKNSLPSFFVRKGKGAKGRLAACNPMTAAAVNEYLREREDWTPGDPLFVTDEGNPRRRPDGSIDGAMLRITLARLCKRAGVPHMHPHLLRHLAASNMKNAGEDLEDIRLQMGHSSLLVTQRYLHVSMEDRQRKHLRASPLERYLGEA